MVLNAHESSTMENIDRLRKIHRILVMHYVENLSQAEIAKRTGISHPTINRLVKEGHERGFVEISIRSPIQQLFDIEKQLLAATSLKEAIVTGTSSDLDDVRLPIYKLRMAEVLGQPQLKAQHEQARQLP